MLDQVLFIRNEENDRLDGEDDGASYGSLSATFDWGKNCFKAEVQAKGDCTLLNASRQSEE